MRLTKESVRELIMFAKSIKITAHYWDPTANSAYHFGRQMVSKKLQKANPSFQSAFLEMQENKPAMVAAEFLDGSKWETNTAGLSVRELREEFYRRCADAEDNVDVGGDDKGGKAGGKGGAADKGKGGKK